MLFLLSAECKWRILKPKWFVASTISSTGWSFFGKRLSCATCSASMMVYKETGVEISTSADMNNAISSNFFIFLSLHYLAPVRLSLSWSRRLTICKQKPHSSTFTLLSRRHKTSFSLLFPITSNQRLLMTTKLLDVSSDFSSSSCWSLLFLRHHISLPHLSQWWND